MADTKMSVDIAKIKMAIRSGIPLSITTYTLPHEMEAYMADVLTAFFTELNQQHMIQYLVYCQNELMINAKKANTKRIYFKEKGLDITNPADYEKGMQSFKNDTLTNINYYLQLQKKAGLYIKLLLQMRNNKIKLEVHNNSILTVFEYKRIHDKLTRAQQYVSVDEAITQIVDEMEGAGLGLVIMILMLEKLGMTEENFQILCENGETITRIILPLSEKTQKDINTISSEFVKSINELPQFPENITKLNRLLSNPNSKMSDIAMQISNDVALTGELLKQVNSATFALASPCSNIADAVKMTGIRGIKNMLYMIGSIKSFTDVSGSSGKLWTHAYEVAFYSYNIARNFYPSEKSIIEDAYTCGLLHDMGKIVFETTHPEFFENIKKICVAKGIAPEIFEKLLSGLNHGEIGALIAEKWNFPDIIVDTIRYHHNPQLTPEANRTLTSIVYLADLMTHYQTGEVDFYQIDPDVLAALRITTEAQFKKISDNLQTAFKAENGK